MRSRAAPATFVLLLALPAVANAALTVENLGCKKGVHLVASHEKISAVLAELGKQLGFTLKFDGDDDRAVDVDMTERAPKLVAKLMETDSVITDDAPDPKCPGQAKLAKVWVLPKGEDGPPPPRALTPMEMYRKAHGLPLDDSANKPKGEPEGAQ